MGKNLGQKEFLTADEAAKYLGIELRELYRDLPSYPSIRRNGGLVFRRVSLDVLLYARNNPPTLAELEKFKIQNNNQTVSK